MPVLVKFSKCIHTKLYTLQNNQMNIKNRKYNLAKLVIFTAFASLGLFFITNPQKTQAQNDPNPIKAYCVSKVPKAKATCQDDKTVQKLRNKASTSCETSKTVQKCIVDKAKEYIDDASGGNPNDRKFKNQLDEVLKKGKGNPDKFSDAAAKRSEEQASKGASPTFSPEFDEKNDRCGNEDSGSSVRTRFDFGCLGNSGPDDMGPIEDVLYAIIRFLSIGVGIVIIGSIILAGIQYSTSEGNPETTQASKNRIQSAVVGLLIYIFAFAIVQFLVPGGVFR